MIGSSCCAVVKLVVVAVLVVALGSIAGCAESQQFTPSSAEEGRSSVAFTEVTNQVGLGDFQHDPNALGEKWLPETMGAGGGFLDYNGDGRLDILLVENSTWPGRASAGPALRLYQNNGDDTFTDATGVAGLAGVSAYGFGITAADYDNDGDQDFYLTTLRQDRLFRNEDGVFQEVTEKAGVAGTPAWTMAALFFDADRDGHLDLYVGGYLDWSPEKNIDCTIDEKTISYCNPTNYEELGSRFYHNNGDGTFSEQTKAAGFAEVPGKALGVAELDFNDDGWPDLVVANDMNRDLLYENNGDGTFTEKGLISGIAFSESGVARAGMGIDVGDVDGSGQSSIFVGNFSQQMTGVYRHVGGGLFTDRAAVSRIGQPSMLMLTFGLFLFDVDLDLDLDLFAANGHIWENVQTQHDGITYQQRPQLFINQGGGTFEEMHPAGGVLAQPMVARGAAYADVDGDGDQDVLVTENGGAAHLWRNDLKDGRFLRVRLEGRASNRDGLGSRVVAVVGDERMERRVRTGSSYLSQSEKTVTFGLGGAREVDTLRIEWPSGTVDELVEVAAGQEVRIVEGRGCVEKALASKTPVRR